MSCGQPHPPPSCCMQSITWVSFSCCLILHHGVELHESRHIHLCSCLMNNAHLPFDVNSTRQHHPPGPGRRKVQAKRRSGDLMHCRRCCPRCLSSRPRISLGFSETAAGTTSTTKLFVSVSYHLTSRRWPISRCSLSILNLSSSQQAP